MRRDEQGRDKYTGGQGLQGPESSGAKLPYRFRRTAHMHQPGLHETFERAGPLAQPIAEPGIGLLKGEAFHHAGAKPEPRQAQTQIRIFGHVMGIPAAGLSQDMGAEMI